MEEKDVKITQDLRIMQAIVKEAIGQNPDGGVTIVNIGQIQITISQNNPEKKSKIRPTIEDKKESEPIKAIEDKKVSIPIEKKKIEQIEQKKATEGERCRHDMVEGTCVFCKRANEGFIEGGKK